jgi:integrase
MLELNPAARVPMFTEDNKIEHYLDDEQLERLLTALRESPARNVANIALFLLSTGARLNEALQPTWDQIDRGNQLWRIPARNSKSKRVRSVPLNETALAILEQLGTEGKFDYLFINAQTNKPIT